MAFERFKERSAVVKQRMSKDKVFVIGAAIIILFLVFQAIRNKDVPEAIEFRYPEGYVQQEDSQSSAEEVATSSNFSEENRMLNQSEEPQWRFYWSDLAILGVGSAFCGIMIIRERRKARESL